MSSHGGSGSDPSGGAQRGHPPPYGGYSTANTAMATPVTRGNSQCADQKPQLDPRALEVTILFFQSQMVITIRRFYVFVTSIIVNLTR